tara:strand:- start:1 stop:291 length:291 start_codon:yes stop_codon:yes gene_type:complete
VKRVSTDDFSICVDFSMYNNAVIVPQFGDEHTYQQTLSSMQKHILDREIVTLKHDPLGELRGVSTAQPEKCLRFNADSYLAGRIICQRSEEILRRR